MQFLMHRGVHLYIYPFVFMYVCMYVCMYACMFKCIYVYLMCVCTCYYNTLYLVESSLHVHAHTFNPILFPGVFVSIFLGTDDAHLGIFFQILNVS